MYRILTHTRPVTAGRPEEKNKSSHHGIIIVMNIMRKRAQKQALGKQITKNSRLQNPLIHFLWKMWRHIETKTQAKVANWLFIIRKFKDKLQQNLWPQAYKTLCKGAKTSHRGAFTENKRGKQMVLTNFATFREGLLRSLNE